MIFKSEMIAALLMLYIIIIIFILFMHSMPTIVAPKGSHIGYTISVKRISGYDLYNKTKAIAIVLHLFRY